MVTNSETIIQAAYQRAATSHNPYLEDIKAEMLRYKVIEHKKHKCCKCDLCVQLRRESSAVRSIRVSQFHSWDTYAPVVQEYYRRRDNARYERKQLEEKFSTFLYPLQNEQ